MRIRNRGGKEEGKGPRGEKREREEPGQVNGRGRESDREGRLRADGEQEKVEKAPPLGSSWEDADSQGRGGYCRTRFVWGEGGTVHFFQKQDPTLLCLHIASNQDA